MDLTTAAMIAAGTGLVTIGGAWGAAKQAMNGTKERVRALEHDNKKNNDRLARIETKIDILIDNQEI